MKSMLPVVSWQPQNGPLKVRKVIKFIRLKVDKIKGGTLKIEKFEEILAWQKAKELTIIIYRTFKECRDFAMKDQIQRASVSIMNNIAEGFERRTNKEFTSFLFMAKGSAGEVRSMVYLVFELRYITKGEFDKIYNLSIEISRMLSGFIKTLKL